MSTHQTLEQLAYGHATSNVISSTGSFEGDWYECYQHMASVSQPDELENWSAVQPYESYDLSELLELIDSEAQVILDAMDSALELAKRGLVLAATSQPLKNVFTGIDMHQMVRVGAA